MTNDGVVLSPVSRGILLEQQHCAKAFRVYHGSMVAEKQEIGVFGHLVRGNVSISQMVCEKRKT